LALAKAKVEEPPNMNRRTNIRNDSQFKIHIVDVMNTKTPVKVRFIHNGMTAESDVKNEKDPVINQAIMFKI
jgi:hypothetical protein